MPVRIARILLAIPMLASAACGSGEEPYQPNFSASGEAPLTYSFAILPQHNPALLHRTYSPLIDHLNRSVEGVRFTLVASPDYAAFQQRLAAGEFDFALSNPYQAVQAAAADYRIFGKMAGDEDFRGLILVRRDSPIRTLADLRGRTISYPAQTAVASAMMPQYYLHAHGVPLKATKPIYVGSMESAIQSVVLGLSDAASVWPDPWEKFQRSRPDLARRLEVRWQTPHLVNNALVANRRVPSEVADKVLASLRALDRSPEGRALLATLSVDGFEGADDRTYDPVRRFLADFSRTVRPLQLAQGPSR